MIVADAKTSELIQAMIDFRLAQSHAVSVSHMRYKEMEDLFPLIRDELNSRIPSMKEAIGNGN